MSNTDPFLPGFEFENVHTKPKTSAHYKGTQHCRAKGMDIELRVQDTLIAGVTHVYLLTTAQAEQLRLDLERALERNANAPFK